MIGRALLVIAIVATTLDCAAAQFGDTPGLPGSPPAGTPPGGPPPKCQALIDIRDELQKRREAISTANQKRADVRVACRLFRTYIATEAKMLRMLEADGRSCGAPAHIVQQVRGSHAKAQQIGKQVCDAAARQPFRHDAPAPPLDDDIIRPFKLHPEPRPKPWPGSYTARRLIDVAEPQRGIVSWRGRVYSKAAIGAALADRLGGHKH